MAHPKFFRDRQGRQFRQCSYCDGAGQITTAESMGTSYDPEGDREETCPDCDGEGDFRVTAIDPLEQIAKARKRIREGLNQRALYWRYRNEQREITPKLPTRYYDDPLFREAKRDCDAALSASAVFMGALGSLTGYRSAA